jgi:hypothetical protein
MKINRFFYHYLLWGLLLLAFSIQALGVYFLTQQMTEYVLLFHLISAVLFPYPLWKLMPKKFENEKFITLLLFLVCALVPFVSGIGLLLSFTLSAYYSQSAVEELTDHIHHPELADNVLDTLQLSQYSGSSLQAILDKSDSEEGRMQAVLKTRQMSDQEAIPILKRALLDSVDEVRLLAYSMLDKKEKLIDNLIRTQQKMLMEKPSKEDSVVHFKLAECYWELSYLGLVQGKAQTHVLGNAYQHIQSTLKENASNAEAYFLQARITLKLDLFDVAKLSLSKALLCGMSPRRVTPYQAEVAFMTRDFNEVSRHVRTVNKTGKKDKVIAEMMEQWA